MMIALVLSTGEDIQFYSMGHCLGLDLGSDWHLRCIRNPTRWHGRTAIGTWASLCVMMNFIWGNLCLRTSKSFHGTCGAFMLLLIGLVGMSTSSASPPTTDSS